MAALPFPTNGVLTELKDSGQLEDALDLYARILVSHKDTQQIAQWCRQYLSSESIAELRNHEYLRRAVYFILFDKRLLIDSPVETFWDIAETYGPTNESIVVNYFKSAPRSVPMKLARLLLYQVEHGTQSTLEFEKTVIVLFSAPNIAETVITSEWKKKLKNINTAKSKTLVDLANNFERDGPVQTLATLFPHIASSKLYALLKTSGQSVEQLTENMFEDPEYFEHTMHSQPIADNKKTKKVAANRKFVKLDEKIKQEKEDAIRRHNQLNFKYDYVSLEEEDPDPEQEGEPTLPELSEADRKLIAQEELLWDHWNAHKEVFDRNARKSDLRKKLREKLNWTNEQIEGWGRMVGAKGREDEDPHLPEQVESYAPAIPNSTNSTASSSNHRNQPRQNSNSNKPGAAGAAGAAGNANLSGHKMGNTRNLKPPTKDQTRKQHSDTNNDKKPTNSYNKPRPKKSGKKNFGPKE